jgi:hypothetical protein
MPRKKIGSQVRTGLANGDLADRLAAELKGGREYGQPLIYEQTFRTGKVRVTVIWDAWDGVPLQERSATILRAYETAEGDDSRDRIALASGLTFPEAHTAGMLPYQIIMALRKDDPVNFDEARRAMLEEGGSTLIGPETVHLWFATAEEAEAARRRLSHRLPKSEPIWVITREITAGDYAGVLGPTPADEA